MLAVLIITTMRKTTTKISARQRQALHLTFRDQSKCRFTFTATVVRSRWSLANAVFDVVGVNLVFALFRNNFSLLEGDRLAS